MTDSEGRGGGGRWDGDGGSGVYKGQGLQGRWGVGGGGAAMGREGARGVVSGTKLWVLKRGKLGGRAGGFAVLSLQKTIVDEAPRVSII